MTLARNRAFAPLAVLLPCLAGIFANNIGRAQSPVKAQAGPPQIATPTRDAPLVALSGFGAGSESAPPFISPPGGTRPSLAGLKNPSPSTVVFIENLGQFDPKVKFQAKIGSQTAWLTTGGIVFDATRQAGAGNVLAAALQPSDSPSSADAVLPFALNRAKPESQTIDRLVFSEDFIGAGCCWQVGGRDPQPGVYNYFPSRDAATWRTNVRRYAEVIYRDIWPGVDLRIYGNGSDLEQEFILQPGADLSRVQINYRGIDGLKVAKDGSLEVATAFGTLREMKPRLYQQMASKKVTVAGRYRLINERSYTFQVEAHNPLYALVVDPTLLYSTYLGGSAGNSPDNYNHEIATGIAVDASGNGYVVGTTYSTDFPTTPGAFQVSPPSYSFITKLNATGSTLVYSTYLGQYTGISAIAVDATGQAYVTGSTWGGVAFPTTPNAYWPTTSQQQCASTDLFVTKLSSAGNQLIYSSCFNSNATPSAIAIDSFGKAYIAGSAGYSIPTTPNAYQSYYQNMPSSVFVTAFDTAASGIASLYYSTYLGVPLGLNAPNAQSSASGIAVDSFGKAYVTGYAPFGFPVTPGAFQVSHGACNSWSFVPCIDAFVAKLDPAATTGSQSLIYSTYLGGIGGDQGNAIAVDASGEAYVTGTSMYGSNSFPVTPGAFQVTNPNQNVYINTFVTKLSAGGSKLIYSTYLDGTDYYAWGNGIAVDSLGDAYVAGRTNASDFPVTADAFQTTYSKPVCAPSPHDCSSAFLTKLNPAGSALIYSSYLGGSSDDGATSVAIDQNGDAYVAGYADSGDFPTTLGVFQPSRDGTGDAFVTKFPLTALPALSISGIGPASGGNVGPITTHVQGGGFRPGATVELIGGSTVVGSNPLVGSQGRTIDATFALAGAPVGSYSLKVVNPDGTSATLPNAFAVQQGGGPQVSVNIVGRSVIHGGLPQYWQIVVSNAGNVDSAGGGLWVSLPAYVAWSLAPDQQLSEVWQNSDSAGFILPLPPVPIGIPIIIPLTLTAPSDLAYAHTTFALNVWSNLQ